MSDWHSADEKPEPGRFVEIKLSDGLGVYVMRGACITMQDGAFFSLASHTIEQSPIVAWRYVDVPQ